MPIIVKRLNQNYCANLIILIACLCCCISCQNKTGQPALDSHFAKFNGQDVFYTVEGAGEITLLFIHGWSCDHTFWHRQIPAFTDQYRVITMDLIGHGQSAKPEIDYTFKYIADSVKAVVDHAGVDQAVLIGHSLGYPIARNFITRYPQRARGLCSVDGAFIRIPVDPQLYAQIKEQNNQIVSGLSSGNRDEFMDQFLSSMYVDSTSAALKEEIKTKMMQTPFHVAQSAMANFVKDENWREYSLNVPTLAVYAQSPDMPPDIEQFLQTQYPNLEFHLWDDAGHFLMMEYPQRFNQLLLNFLAQLKN